MHYDIIVCNNKHGIMASIFKLTHFLNFGKKENAHSPPTPHPAEFYGVICNKLVNFYVLEFISIFNFLQKDFAIIWGNIYVSIDTKMRKKVDSRENSSCMLFSSNFGEILWYVIRGFDRLIHAMVLITWIMQQFIMNRCIRRSSVVAFIIGGINFRFSQRGWFSCEITFIFVCCQAYNCILNKSSLPLQQAVPCAYCGSAD